MTYEVGKRAWSWTVLHAEKSLGSRCHGVFLVREDRCRLARAARSTLFRLYMSALQEIAIGVPAPAVLAIYTRLLLFSQPMVAAVSALLWRPMLSDPAAAAWVVAGRPSLHASSPGTGRCGRCGQHGPTVSSARIVSEKFAGIDAWPFGSRRLCIPCAWAFSRQPATQPALLITTDSVTSYINGAALADVLIAGELPATHAVVLPTARRRHILPTARWGHLATDGLVVRWDAGAVSKLANLAWLRTTVGATWPQLSRSAPPPRLLATQPPEHSSRIITAWSLLDRWRCVPPLWAAARVLTNTPAAQNGPARATASRGTPRALQAPNDLGSQSNTSAPGHDPQHPPSTGQLRPPSRAS